MWIGRRHGGVAALSTLVVAVTLLLGGLAGCSSDDGSDDGGPTPVTGSPLVRVPVDAPTIEAAVAAVAPGGMVLIEAGTYLEGVTVDKADVTIRGLDRNGVVIDGEGTRPYGLMVTADGVRVENLTVRSTAFYGVLFTGAGQGDELPGDDGYREGDGTDIPPLERFSVDHVTAYNNGLYGIYAFNARHGVIRDSYASGSPDSGIYVGQCRDCDVLVTGNVAERNAVGFENANASDSVTVVGNRFSGNRVGMTLLSNYQEAFAPQRANVIVGNVVVENSFGSTPQQADGGFGVGVGISGGQDNRLERNLIGDHPVAGVVLTNTEDLAATGNRFVDNLLSGNGVDVANTSSPRTPASGNCVVGALASLLPPTLDLNCDAPGGGAGEGTEGAEQPAVEPGDLPMVEVPAGISFLDVDPPPAQPDMGDEVDLEEPPSDPLPDSIDHPDLDAVTVPDVDLLLDRSWFR